MGKSMPKHNYLSLLSLPCSNVTMQGMSSNVVGMVITLYEESMAFQLFPRIFLCYIEHYSYRHMEYSLLNIF